MLLFQFTCTPYFLGDQSRLSEIREALGGVVREIAASWSCDVVNQDMDEYMEVHKYMDFDHDQLSMYLEVQRRFGVAAQRTI